MLRWLRRDERGQSFVEVTVVSVFLILLVVMIFEAGVMFSSYMALLNASREGAMYASAHLALLTLPTTDSKYAIYTENVVKAEVQMGNMLQPQYLTIQRPVLVNGTSSFGDPIKVQVNYELHTFTSGISLPFFGRFGLPPYWPLSAWTIMPIR